MKVEINAWPMILTNAKVRCITYPSGRPARVFAASSDARGKAREKLDRDAAAFYCSPRGVAATRKPPPDFGAFKRRVVVV